MHFLKTQLFQKVQLLKVEPNSPLSAEYLIAVMAAFLLSFVATLFRDPFPINAEVFSFSMHRFYTVLALSSGSALGCRGQNRPRLYL